MAELILKPGKERSLLRRHPWVYDTAIAQLRGKPDHGETLAIRSHDGAWLAWAAYSPQSTIRARCWSFAQTDCIDSVWLKQRVSDAVERRESLAAQTDAVRLVFGEADGLPGLVADRYGSQLVVQFQAAGVEAQREILIDALAEATGCVDVYERSDSATRQREGLAPASGVVRGAEPPERIRISEQDIAYWVDVRHGHKTGAYIDQRDNRKLVGDLVVGLKANRTAPVSVLNCFSYTGGFSLAAGVSGADAVLSIDASAEALALARHNWALNELPDIAAWQQADAFDALRALRGEGQLFDVIVLDPPKFASSHHHVDRAARAYKDINLQALRLLAPGGFLLTFSCSGAVGVDLFQKVVAGSVIDSRVDVQMLKRLAAGEDHPLAMTHPEGEYLKGLLLRRT